MKRAFPFITVLISLCLLAACTNGLITPSQHSTEQYSNAFAAASSGDVKSLRAEIDKDPSVLKATEWDQRTLLDDAVDKSQIEAVKFLLDQGSDVNAVTTDGRTALHMAAQNGDLPIMTLLLARGAKINSVDAKHWTPLDRATKWGHAAAAAYLRAQGGRDGSSEP
jgi:ankyrin repeat protein